MKLGGEYRLRNIRLYHWRKLAQEDSFETMFPTSDAA